MTTLEPMNPQPMISVPAKQLTISRAPVDGRALDRLVAMASQSTGAEFREADAKLSTADETARLREENLRLRDQLIAREAEMGTLRGRVAELEAGTARVMHLYVRVRSLAPAWAWGMLARLSRLAKR